MRLTREERQQVWRASKLAAEAFNVFRPLLFLSTRGSIRVTTARQCAMYLANVTAQIPLMRVGKAFGRDVSTVSHDIGRIEDCREDLEFDQLMSALEKVFQGEEAEAAQWKDKHPPIVSLAALEPV